MPDYDLVSLIYWDVLIKPIGIVAFLNIPTIKCYITFIHITLGNHVNLLKPKIMIKFIVPNNLNFYDKW